MSVLNQSGTEEQTPASPETVVVAALGHEIGLLPLPLRLLRFQLSSTILRRPWRVRSHFERVKWVEWRKC